MRIDVITSRFHLKPLKAFHRLSSSCAPSTRLEESVAARAESNEAQTVSVQPKTPHGLGGCGTGVVGHGRGWQPQADLTWIWQMVV